MIKVTRKVFLFLSFSCLAYLGTRFLQSLCEYHKHATQYIHLLVFYYNTANIYNNYPFIKQLAKLHSFEKFLLLVCKPIVLVCTCTLKKEKQIL